MEDYTLYYPWKERECDISSDGYVQPYADSPMDSENVGEHVYLQSYGNTIISRYFVFICITDVIL